MFFENEEFKIGDAAPEQMGGPKTKKKKAAEDFTAANGARPAKIEKNDGSSAGHPLRISKST